MMYKYQDKIKYFERILSNYIFSYKLISFKNFKMVSPATYIYQTLKEDKYNILTNIIYDSSILFMPWLQKILRRIQNPYIEEEQITQWPKEKVQQEKQRSTKHTHKTKDRVTRTPLKTGGELRCSGSVRSSCSTSDTRRVNLVI